MYRSLMKNSYLLLFCFNKNANLVSFEKIRGAKFEIYDLAENILAGQLIDHEVRSHWACSRSYHTYSRLHRHTGAPHELISSNSFRLLSLHNRLGVTIDVRELVPGNAFRSRWLWSHASGDWRNQPWSWQIMKALTRSLQPKNIRPKLLNLMTLLSTLILYLLILFFKSCCRFFVRVRFTTAAKESSEAGEQHANVEHWNPPVMKEPNNAKTTQITSKPRSMRPVFLGLITLGSIERYSCFVGRHTTLMTSSKKGWIILSSSSSNPYH